MHVQEREVALAQRHEVALGAQVVLDGDRPALAGDGEAELGLRAGLGRALGQAHAQAVDVEALGGRGQRLGAHRPVDGEVVGERVGLLAHGEVGEHAVGARLGEGDGERPGAVRVLGRVQVLEAGHVAAHDDEVHALGVLDVEVAHGLAVAVDDPEGQLERLALRRGIASEFEREALLADRQAAHRLRRHLLLAVAGGAHRAHAGLGGLGLPGCTSIRLPANAAPANTSARTTANPASLVATFMPSPALERARWWWWMYSSGRSSITPCPRVAVVVAVLLGAQRITPAMASSITTCSMTISTPMSVSSPVGQGADDGEGRHEHRR